MVITTLLLIGLWGWGATFSTPVFVAVYVWQLLMAVVVSVMVHNHQHMPMWKKKSLNVMTDNWLTVFYGFPIFVWIPTHNSNHHVHINKEPDYTKTYRYSEKNNLVTLLSYPSISGYFQQKVISKYVKELWGNNRKKFWMHAIQITTLVVWTVAALLVDWRKALFFVVIPQQVSLFTVLIFNYLQHVHADEETKYNSSRNFTGQLLNFILINNGLHTAHHVSPGIHWSRLPELHTKLEPKIDSRLNENRLDWYLFRTYVLAVFMPSMRARSMRTERQERLAKGERERLESLA
jgi:beta-carotene hydroxylase